MKLGDYLDSLNNTKINLIDRDANCEKWYTGFVVNKAFSHFPVTIFQANFMNKMNHLPKKMQYDYYFYSISKRKRYSPWKVKEEDENIANLCKYYNISTKKAKEALNILTEEQLKHIHDSLNSNENIK